MGWIKTLRRNEQAFPGAKVFCVAREALCFMTPPIHHNLLPTAGTVLHTVLEYTDELQCFSFRSYMQEVFMRTAGVR